MFQTDARLCDLFLEKLSECVCVCVRVLEYTRVHVVSCIPGWSHIHYVTKDNSEILILQNVVVIL